MHGVDTDMLGVIRDMHEVKRGYADGVIWKVCVNSSNSQVIFNI